MRVFCLSIVAFFCNDVTRTRVLCGKNFGFETVLLLHPLVDYEEQYFSLFRIEFTRSLSCVGKRY